MDAQPVACTLRPAEFTDWSEAWRRLLTGWLVGREPSHGGARLTLRGAPGVADAARELAALEAECCPWMVIEVGQRDGESEEVTLSATSREPGGPEAIRELFHVPG